MESERMPLMEHLGELRKRITISLIALLTAFVFAFNYSEELFKSLMFPLKYSLSFSMKNPFISIIPQEKLSQTTKLVFLAPAEAFWMSIKVAFVAALALALPVIFHQVWKFMSPGLLAREKKYVLPIDISLTPSSVNESSYAFVSSSPSDALSFTSLTASLS